MAQVLINGLKIDFDDVGQGQAVVLIHGHPFNRSMWHPQVTELQSAYRMITFDLRGYGQSAVPDVNQTFLGDFASDIAALMDVRGVESAVVMGLSMGGQIALEFYRQCPKRVTALVLADTFAQVDTDEGKKTRYQTADRLIHEGMEAYANEVLSKMITPNTITTQPDVAQHVMDMMHSTPPQGAAAALRGRAERQDYTPLLSQISVPTLIVVGEEDAFTPVPQAEYMHQRIANSTLEVIANSGHMPNLEQPERFNKVLVRFLRGIS